MPTVLINIYQKWTATERGTTSRLWVLLITGNIINSVWLAPHDVLSAASNIEASIALQQYLRQLEWFRRLFRPPRCHYSDANFSTINVEMPCRINLTYLYEYSKAERSRPYHPYEWRQCSVDTAGSRTEWCTTDSVQNTGLILLRYTQLRLRLGLHDFSCRTEHLR